MSDGRLLFTDTDISVLLKINKYLIFVIIILKVTILKIQSKYLLVI